MATDRRSFFAASLSWLAALPAFAWMARPVEASELDEFPVTDADAAFMRLHRVIRWISVKERLPTTARHINNRFRHESLTAWSDDLIVTDGNHVGPGRFARNCEGDSIWLGCPGVTHWAEFPSGPSDSREGVK